MTRRLIVCSDGTWNTPDRKEGGVFAPSNVVKMARAILPVAADGTPQFVFYDPGVGTGSLLDKWAGAFGVGLDANVRDAYLLLVHNYTDGDELYLFGFSRGAYTVRSAAGLIRKCGLLRKAHADLVPEAFAIYRKRDKSPDTEEAVQFRDKHSRHPLPIKFIGVWETVGALGIPVDLPFRLFSRARYQFHDVSLSRSVDFAYQALAIDERRRPFRPAIWEQHPQAEHQVLEQAWFAGVHTDVGGGYNQCGLSDVALCWIKEKAEATGLVFDETYLAKLRPDPLAELHDSRKFPHNLLPPYSRPIGCAPNAQEQLHPTALERYTTIGSYRPENLVAYLRRRRPR